ncbi:hypothetical protein ABG067_009206, partial [Albugo candida]
MVEEVTKKMKIDADVLIEETRLELSTQYKSNEEELLREMIPKKEAEAMTLAAVALANKEVQKEVDSLKNVEPAITDDMISKEEANKLIQDAIESEQLKIQQVLHQQKLDIEAS